MVARVLPGYHRMLGGFYVVSTVELSLDVTKLAAPQVYFQERERYVPPCLDAWLSYTSCQSRH